jgi:hypothetical protein
MRRTAVDGMRNMLRSDQGSVIFAVIGATAPPWSPSSPWTRIA